MLTDSICKGFKPRMKPYLKADCNGMGMEIYPNGSKYWRLRYRIAGKAKLISLGVYPEVSLKEAREKAIESRKLVKDGIDPSKKRKQDKLELKENIENTFENIANEYLDKKKLMLSTRYHQYIMRRMQKHVFPVIGNMAIANISAKDFLAILQNIENRGTVETAHRILQEAGQVFRYAISIGKTSRDITADLKGGITPAKEKHYAYLSEKELKDFFKKTR